MTARTIRTFHRNIGNGTANSSLPRGSLLGLAILWAMLGSITVGSTAGGRPPASAPQPATATGHSAAVGEDPLPPEEPEPTTRVSSPQAIVGLCEWYDAAGFV